MHRAIVANQKEGCVVDWKAIAIQGLQAGHGHKFSEADTQRLIIEPLLMWLGYNTLDPTEVREQVPVHGAGRQAGIGHIDYTVSRGEQVYLIVEAKSLTTTLNKSTIQQTLAYCNAHEQRPRWGVLTNGTQWDIYDARATGKPFDRLILSIDVTEDLESLTFLRWENRAHLTQYANLFEESRGLPDGELKTFVRESLLTKLMQNVLGTYDDTAHDSPSTTEIPQTEPTPSATAERQVQPVEQVVPTHTSFTGRKPVSIALRGRAIPVTSWKSVLIEVATDLHQNFSLPVPQHTPRTNKPMLANSSNNMRDGRKIAPNVFVETWLSASQVVKRSRLLLQSCGLAETELVIHLED